MSYNESPAAIALAGVVGPLIEVPVLVGLVYVALWLRGRLPWPLTGPCTERRADAHRQHPAHHRLLHERAVLDRAASELAAAYPGLYAVETVRRLIGDSYDLLADRARITTHLVTLSIRLARERLAATAQAQGHLVTTTPEVLFVRVHNAGRSQMAAALLHHHAHGRVHVRSAGYAPPNKMNPAVLEVMHEIGLDLSAEFPKPLTDDVVQAADVVITMGCGAACPIYPGERYLDWDLTDPAGLPTDRVRLIRDDIEQPVRALLNELAPASV